MKFGYTIIYVPDVGAAVRFYEEAFGLEKKFLTDEQDYGEMNTGETTLAFANLDLARSNLPSGFMPNRVEDYPAAIEVAFVTDDVQSAYDRALECGAHTVSGPKSKPWGQDVAYVRDLNGVVVELCSPIGE